MNDNTKLNERLSVADLRMYEGKKMVKTYQLHCLK